MNRPYFRRDSIAVEFAQLSKKVTQIVQSKNLNLESISRIKAVVLLVLYCSCLLTLWLSVSNSYIYILCSVVLGILCLPIVLNIGHEAVHGNLSSEKRLNRMGLNIFYLLGTSPYFWELRHLSSHHLMVNVKDWDLDIEQSNIIRLSRFQPHHFIHRIQHYFMPILYSMYTLIWFWYRDFKDIGRKEFGCKYVPRHPAGQIIRLFLAKIWHLLAFVIIPYLLNGEWKLILSGFFCMHIAASMSTTFVLISSHVGEPQEIISADNKMLPYSWIEHQYRTTADFCTTSSFFTHFFGGFNHHLAHHLFPNINHNYYPFITPLLVQFAKENDIPYYSYDNLIRTSMSHLKRLRELSVLEDM